MDLKLRQQQFNFGAFARLRCAPLASAKFSEHATFAQAADAIETVFWLGLGVELSVYPDEAVQGLLSRSKSVVLELEKAAGERLDLVMPEIQRLELAELLERGQAHHFPDRIAPEQALLPYFHGAVQLSHRMNGDSLGAVFREFLMFSTPTEWDELVRPPASVDTVNYLVLHRPHTPMLSLESLIAGFFCTVKDMIPWKGLFTILEQDDVIGGSKSTLVRRIGRITGWSLDLNLAGSNERFLGIAEVAAAMIHDISTLPGSTVVADAQTFKDMVRDLAEVWKGFHPKFLTMTA